MANQLSQKETEEILRPHFPILSKIMTESLEDLNKALSILTENTNNRAKSALLHSIAIEKAKKYFDSIKEVSIKCKYQSIQIVFANKIVGRIKKINKDNLSANAKTKRNDAILSHQTSLFDGMVLSQLAPSVFVDLGYNINETGSEYNKLNIVCRNSKEVEWYFSFKSDENVNVISHEQTDALGFNEETQIVLKKAK
jgi:hypothetical protein